MAAAALCIGALSGCSRETAAPPPPADDVESAAPPETGSTPSSTDLDEQLRRYLGNEKQTYDDETREYLGEPRAELSLPVPPIEPMEREKPSLALPGAPEPDPEP
jgi:hypothetical protein